MHEPISSVALEEKMRRTEEALTLSEAKLKYANEEIEKRVQEKAADLIKTNQALQAEVIERKKIAEEILEITQEEQRRFGSQLHDGLCQELTGILMFTKGLIKKMEKGKRLDVAELKQISDLLDGTVSQTRDMARGLYPGELEATSLMRLLEELASNTQSLSDVSCCFHCPEPILIDENDVATHLYKIAQEGIGNAVKHGKAKSIEVSLIRSNNNIVLTIKDKGVGFANDSKSSKGIGLKIMKHRAHMIDASFQVESNVPQGVVLKCALKI